MDATEIVEGLAGFVGRGAGSDAERRAAAWLASALSSERREPAIETFWCRPNWALAHALHAALAIAGSLTSLASPIAGTAILAVALVSILADSLTGVSIGRRLTREHASQNVVLAPAIPDTEDAKPVRLVLIANYDAGRAGLIYRDPLRRPAASLRRATRAATPGWLAWLTIATAWLLALAIVRLTGHSSGAISALQLPPTVGVLVGFALLLELAAARWSPSAGDNATGIAVAAALAQAVEATPPRNVDVELLLAGAGDWDGTGLRRYLRSRRGERTPRNTVVLGLAACAGGTPHWWVSDGPLIPLRYAQSLRKLAERIASAEPHLHLASHKGRGTTPALTARAAGIPALTLGALDLDGLSPRSHQQTDTRGAVDRDALDTVFQVALLMLDAVDAAVGELQATQAAPV
jgi:hypothetical protein